MPQLIIKHKVKDFNLWKKLFDASFPLRQLNGEKNCKVFRNTEDPNDLTLLFDWDDPQKAVRYSESEELRIAMKNAGVIDGPHVYIDEHDIEA